MEFFGKTKPRLNSPQENMINFSIFIVEAEFSYKTNKFTHPIRNLKYIKPM